MFDDRKLILLSAMCVVTMLAANKFLAKYTIAIASYAIVLSGCWQEVHYSEPVKTANTSSDAANYSQLTSTMSDAQAFGEELAAVLAATPVRGELLSQPAASPTVTVGEPATLPEKQSDEPPVGLPSQIFADDRYRLNRQNSPPSAEVPPPAQRTTNDPPSPNTFSTIEPAPISTPFSTAGLSPDELPKSPAPSPVERAATRRAAWNLGSKWSLAALARERGVSPDDVAKWLAHSRQLAQSLGTSLNDLPPLVAADRGASMAMIAKYLITEGQRIGRDLADKHGLDHVALFELALKSNVLLVLYEPRSPVSEALANSLAQARETSGLPAQMWQPLLSAVAEGREPEAVRRLVFQLHENVDRSLLTASEQ
jgi:hypothetical protein